MNVSIELSCSGLPFMSFHQGSNALRNTSTRRQIFQIGILANSFEDSNVHRKVWANSGIPLPASTMHAQTYTKAIFVSSVPPVSADIPPCRADQQRGLGHCPSREKAASETEPSRWQRGKSVNTRRLIRKAKKEKRYQKPNPENIKMLVWFIYIFFKSAQEKTSTFGFF